LSLVKIYNNCYCLLITVGAKCISELMDDDDCSLEVLWIGWNNIGDDGITALAGALGNTKIRELNVANCGITIVGAKELATALSINQTIKTLNLYENPITVEGAHLILKSAINNGVCEEVAISTEYWRDNEVQQMMKTLQIRREENRR